MLPWPYTADQGPGIVINSCTKPCTSAALGRLNSVSFWLGIDQRYIDEPRLRVGLAASPVVTASSMAAALRVRRRPLRRRPLSRAGLCAPSSSSLSSLPDGTTRPSASVSCHNHNQETESVQHGNACDVGIDLPPSTMRTDETGLTQVPTARPLLLSTQPRLLAVPLLVTVCCDVADIGAAFLLSLANISLDVSHDRARADKRNCLVSFARSLLTRASRQKRCDRPSCSSTKLQRQML